MIFLLNLDWQWNVTWDDTLMSGDAMSSGYQCSVQVRNLDVKRVDILLLPVVSSAARAGPLTSLHDWAKLFVIFLSLSENAGQDLFLACFC